MMKRMLLLTGLLCLVMTGLCWAAITKNLDPHAASQLLQQRSVFLLDVRTFGEYQQARLDDAHLIPVDQLNRRLGEIPKDKPVLVYCAVGSRSAQVVNYLARLGFPEVYNLKGGIYGWANYGLPFLRGRP